jgi:phosphocarrier protein FPr
MGLHLRPATQFVKIARQFRCTVVVIHGDRRANGHSPFELLSLIAAPGSEVILELTGADAETAAERLAEVLADPGEDSSHGNH